MKFLLAVITVLLAATAVLCSPIPSEIRDTSDRGPVEKEAILHIPSRQKRGPGALFHIPLKNSLHEEDETLFNAQSLESNEEALFHGPTKRSTDEEDGTLFHVPNLKNNEEALFHVPNMKSSDDALFHVPNGVERSEDEDAIFQVPRGVQQSKDG